ncbi:MAG: ABC transporter ATP-binding protein/permease [Clostridia bacterium]|nr:ABC transporter ATP-binding protein/permease [Clostridia bacterium]
MKKTTFVKILRLINNHKAALVFSFVMTVFSVACALYIPVLAGRAIDLISGKGSVDFSQLKPLLIKISAFAVSAGVFQWSSGLINNKLTLEIVRDIRNTATAKISRLPVSYIDSHPVGDTVSRIISDAEQFSEGLLLGFTNLFSGVLTIAGTLIFMMRVSLRITPVVVLLTPLSLLVARFVARKTHSMFMRQSEVRGRQTSLIDESIAGKKVISSYGSEKYFTDRFDEINEDFASSSLKAIFYSSITNPSTRFVNNIIFAFVALTGAITVMATGAMTVGGLSCFLAYAGRYAKPFNEISGVITELQNAFACSERIFDFIEAKESENTEKPGVEITGPKGQVSFENVSFSYIPGKKLITGLNLDVAPGSRIAIVGPTGCGKTTLINLLLRFYDPDEGTIRFDGTDIRDVPVSSLRLNYGMVLQDTWIKTASVRENIALASPGATDEEIKEAAKAAYAHSFISRLPDGYDTVISDASTEISHGQKQLICVARILLTNPAVVILDEATSSIDTRTELKIRNAFNLISEGKTCFTVAHRLGTIKNSDLILVMKDGDIVEKGTHEQLLDMHGFYEQLYNSRVT